MKDRDYIHKAIELVGWSTTRLGNQRIAVFIPTPYDITHVLRIGYLDEQHIKDALRCELERQLDTTNRYYVSVSSKGSAIYDSYNAEQICIEQGDDRTMNTIKVIVDSKKLKKL